MRLTAYAPGTTTKLGYLPEPLSVQASWAHNDAGALRVEYPSAALGGGLLARGLHEGMDVRVEVRNGTGWVEPRSSRFLLIGRDVSLTDLTATVSLTLPSYGWLLRKARNLETANLLPADHTQAGKRPFYSATPGTIVKTLLQENAARGGIPLTADFTTTHDSLGAPWAKVATLYYDLGLDLGTIVENLAAQGLCDWWTEGTTLRMVNPDAGATDRSATVRLHLGKDVTDAPSSESLEELATKLLVRMEEGKTLTRTAPGGPAPWGTWEGFLSQGGVNDTTTAALLADAELARVGRTRGQYTRAITLDTNPMVAWQPGDWVQAPTYGTTREKVRAQQVTMTLGADGVQASAILNDRVLDAELRRAKRLNGITGGSGAAGTGRPAESPENDRRQPAAPLGLVVQSDALILRGIVEGTITAQWGQVTTATDSTAQEIARYELWGRLNVAGTPWRRIATTEDLSTTAIGGFTPGSSWVFRVRAMARYSPVAGAWSSTVTVLIESDVTPPSVPSAPTLRTKLGVILVDWDGLTASGGTMEPDFLRVDVGMATSSAGALTVTDSLEAKGTAAITGQPYGQTRWIALRSVDRSGNASAWSTRASIATTALVDTEAIIKRLDLAQVEIGTSGIMLDAKLAGVDSKASQATLDAQDAFNQAVTAWDKALASANAGGNLVLNGGFEQTDAAGNPVEWPNPSSVVSYPTGSARSGTRHARFGAVESTSALYFQSFPASTGRSYYVEAWVKREGTTDPDTAWVGLIVRGRTAAGGYGYAHARVRPSAISTAEWTKVSGTVTLATANVVSAVVAPYLSGGPIADWYHFDDIIAVDVTEAEAARQAALAAQDAASTLASNVITGSVIEYSRNSSETTAPTSGWSTTPPTRTPGTFIWMRTRITRGDNTTSTTAAVLLTGNAGPAGTSVTIKGHVATSSQLPTSAADGDGWITDDTGHLWVRAGSTWTDVGRIQGDPGPPGSDGADGISILSLTPHYRRQASALAAPAKPTTLNPGSGWQTTEPDYLANNSLYRSERVVYSNGSFAWTDVTKVAAWEIAAQAITSANGRNSIILSTSAASGSTNPNTGLPLVDGDTWWRRDAFNRVIGQWTWLGSWVMTTINHQVISSVDVNKLVVTGSATMAEAVIDKLWTDVVRSRKITTDMLLVGRGANLLPWEPSAGTDPHVGLAGTTLSTTQDDDYGWAMRLSGGTVSSGVPTSVIRLASGRTSTAGMSDAFDVADGESYLVRVGVSAAGTYPSGVPNVRAVLNWYNKAGTWLGATTGTDVVPPFSGTVTYASVSGAVPAGAVSMLVNVRQDQPGPLLLFAAEVIRQSDASLIVDGGILARHIATAQIEAGHLAANSVTADKIEAGALDAEVITGGNIRTSATNPRNLINSNGVSAYDSAGTLQARLGSMTSKSGTWGVEVRDPFTGIMAPLASTLYGTRAFASVTEAGGVNIGQPVDTGWGGITGSYVEVVLPTGRARVEVSALLRYGDDTPTLCKGGNYWVGCEVKQGSTVIAAPSSFYAAQEKFPASGVLGLRNITANWVVELTASATVYRFTVARRAQTWAGTGNAINASLLAHFITVTPL